MRDAILRTLLTMFAQFETDVWRDRQAEGIAKAKKAGAYTGATARIDRNKVLALINDGYRPAAAARALGISRMTIYRILGETQKRPIAP